jgi:hypothetical protein
MTNELETIYLDEDDAGDGALPPLTDPKTTRDMFAETIYGTSPTAGYELSVNGIRELEHRRELGISLRTDRGQVDFAILVHLPEGPGPHPCILGLNFAGNHTTVADGFPSIPTTWVPNRTAEGVLGPVATQAGRGCLARRWPVDLINRRGWAVATVYSGDFASDDKDRWRDGIVSCFADSWTWGCLAAWSFGLSRSREALTASGLPVGPITAIGHSRMGKAALWAVTQDAEFAGVISNGSGCLGSTLSRRRIGERQLQLNHRFPHWTTAANKGFDEGEERLPVDQHQLLALAAPRPCIVTSAVEDRWADPHGSELAVEAAAPAWGSQPRIGHHLRPGPHDLTAVDWHQALAFLEAWH